MGDLGHVMELCSSASPALRCSLSSTAAPQESEGSPGAAHLSTSLTATITPQPLSPASCAPGPKTISLHSGRVQAFVVSPAGQTRALLHIPAGGMQPGPRWLATGEGGKRTTDKEPTSPFFSGHQLAGDRLRAPRVR